MEWMANCEGQLKSFSNQLWHVTFHYARKMKARDSPESLRNYNVWIFMYDYVSFGLSYFINAS